MAERDITIEIPQDSHEWLAYRFSTQYSDPLKALREYITNAVDALTHPEYHHLYGSEEGLVKIILAPEDKRIIVTDNAKGMNAYFVEHLPKKVTQSIKRGRTDQRGEHGIGILAFGSMGHQVHILSKEQGENEYNYLRYEKRTDSIKARGDTLSRETVEKNFYGSFPHGTKIIIDVNPYFLKNNLAEEEIERFTQETYLPLLRRKQLRFMIGKQGSIFRTINEPSLLGAGMLINLIDKELPFQVQFSREIKDYSLFARLVFHPERDNGRVGVYSKDVRVYESILGLEKRLAKCDFWACRLISGFINEPNLKIVLGRDGIQKDTKAYEGFIDILEKIHEQYWPQIQVTVKRSRTQMANKFLTDALKLLRRAYQVTKPLNVIPRISNPNPHPPGPPGKKSKGRKVPFGMRFESFGLGEERLRAKLDDSNMGEPVIVYNKDINDFQEHVVNGKPRQALEYLFDVGMPQAALFEVKDALEKGVSTYRDPDVRIREVIRRSQDLKYAAFGKKCNFSQEDAQEESQ